MGNSASADDLEERLIDFAVRVIKVADRLPKRQRANISRGNYCVLAHHRLRITRKHEVAKATRTLFTS